MFIKKKNNPWKIFKLVREGEKVRERDIGKEQKIQSGLEKNLATRLTFYP
jgi:hypothetical protein